MAKTYTQLYVHLVFAVKNREALINAELEPQLYKMMATIINNCGHKTIAIGGMPDHVHLFIGLHPDMPVSVLVKKIKTVTTTWINGQNLLHFRFGWQEGYGAFSYSRSQIDDVANYVRNQKERHKKVSFHDEYIKLLQLFGVDFDERFVFQKLE